MWVIQFNVGKRVFQSVLEYQSKQEIIIEAEQIADKLDKLVVVTDNAGSHEIVYPKNVREQRKR